MLDKGKVIKGVHDARKYLEDREWVDKSVGVHIDALNDALSLLKEQEPVEAPLDAFGHPYCPKCKVLVYQTWHYCPHCGKAVQCNERPV